ncbi:hypothetical protein HN51_012964, partial [Arachis hypogaea]
LVEVAHRVYLAQNSLVSGLSQLARLIPVLHCELCNEVHIGYVGHEIQTCTGPRSGSSLLGAQCMFGEGEGLHMWSTSQNAFIFMT